MGRRPANGPTGAELEILTVLWGRGPSTVRQVNEQLNAERRTGQTTTLKLMQIMIEKGLLARDESVRPQVYRPQASRDVVQGRLIGDLMKRAFDGSTAQLVLRALSTQQASAQERAEIRRLLDEMEGVDI
jgi:BlaI family transcriptional regulator, penicillinase repressor